MALGAVCRQLLGGVVGVGGLVVVGVVAAVAGVGGIGVVSVVAQVALVGDGYMCADERINGIMVKSSRCPSRLGMALCAIGGQLLRGVVGVGCLVVIGVVATVAGVGGIVIIAVVTGGAVVRDGGVRPDQSIEIIV